MSIVNLDNDSIAICRMCSNQAFCIAEHEGECNCYDCDMNGCVTCLVWSNYIRDRI